jgi:hypothetical protein
MPQMSTGGKLAPSAVSANRVNGVSCYAASNKSTRRKAYNNVTILISLSKMIKLIS